MLPALAIAMFLGSLLSHGRQIVDFSNDILNNVVSIAGDAHQAKVAQDIFRQEIRYERSLQMRDDIRDMNKLMMESVSSTLFLGSIVLGTCFVTVIEGFPPLESNRMVIAWWLLFATWSINYNILAIWFALCFQLKISSSARERLLRRYRYRLPDDGVVARMGGQNLVNTMFRLNAMVVEHVGQLVWNQAREDPRAAPGEEEPGEAEEAERELAPRVRVASLDPTEPLDCARLRKGLHAWTHSSGLGRARPRLLDLPFFLQGETLVRSRWHCTGERPLLLRVFGEATLYLAAQCPPLGGAALAGAAGAAGAAAGGGLLGAGVRKAMGAEVPEWPLEELPQVTAGAHPAWRGPGGRGVFRRVEGYRVFVDAHNVELPLYKLVLAAPAQGHTDVILCWRFRAGCEALLVMLRKGHVHCQEEDWPMVEFNDEVCQITPLQDYSGLYLRRGIVCLAVNVSFSVLSKVWVLGQRSMWWLEPSLMFLLMLPVLIVIYFMPINVKSTQEALSMPVVSSVSQAGAPAGAVAAKGASKWDEMAGYSTDAEAGLDSPPRVPRQSSGGRQSVAAGGESLQAQEGVQPVEGGEREAARQSGSRGQAASSSRQRQEGLLRISVVEQDAPAGLLFTCGPPCSVSCGQPCSISRQSIAAPEAYGAPHVVHRGEEAPERAGPALRGAAAARGAGGGAGAGAAPGGAAPAPERPAAPRRWPWGAGCCGRRGGAGEPEAPAPAVAGRLRALTCLLDCAFLASVLVLVASPVIDWGRAPVVLGPAGG